MQCGAFLRGNQHSSGDHPSVSTSGEAVRGHVFVSLRRSGRQWRRSRGLSIVVVVRLSVETCDIIIIRTLSSGSWRIQITWPSCRFTLFYRYDLIFLAIILIDIVHRTESVFLRFP